MMFNWLKVIAIFLFAFLLNRMAFADDVVELPQEELARESVTPVFDRPMSVRGRNIITAKRFDTNFFYGLALSEPIYSVSKLGFSFYYNPNEFNSFGLIYAKNFSGLSTYASQLNTQFNLDFNRAPAPDYMVMGDWNIKMFYGKMSLTKNSVVNLSFYGTVAAGAVKYVHKMYPAIAGGFGQKFFFSKNWALRFDMRLYINQAPIPFLDGGLRVSPSATPDPVPSYSQFNERITYTTMLDAGLTYLF